MLVVDLVCAQGHGFEGWFQSADDLASQQERGLVTCPICGHHEVTRRPSATRYNRSGVGDAGSAVVPPRVGDPVPSQDGVDSVQSAEVVKQLQTAYWQAVRQVMTSTEDVGERFADEARRMHHGEEPPRPIRGQTSSDEAKALRDEGIEVVSLLVPSDMKDTLQ